MDREHLWVSWGSRRGAQESRVVLCGGGPGGLMGSANSWQGEEGINGS